MSSMRSQQNQKMNIRKGSQNSSLVCFGMYVWSFVKLGKQFLVSGTNKKPTHQKVPLLKHNNIENPVPFFLLFLKMCVLLTTPLHLIMFYGALCRSYINIDPPPALN